MHGLPPLWNLLYQLQRWLSRDILLPYQNPSQLFLWRQRGWLWRRPVWRSQLYRGHLPSMQRAAMHERLPDWCDYPQQKEGCITVDHKRCIGCSACTTACPWMMATVNTESKKSSKCVLCGECANACPTGALKIIEWKDITVWILQRKKSWLTVDR